MPPRKRLLRSFALVLAVLGALTAALPSSAATGKRVRSKEIAPGVTLTVIRDYGGPFRIRIVSFHKDSEVTLDTMLANDRLPKYETTSSMARRSGAIAAINGDYARSTGRPVHTFAADGTLAQTPLAWGRNFAVDHSGSNAYMGNPKVTGWARRVDGTNYQISLVNAGAPTGDQIARFTREGGGIEKPPADACVVRLYATETPRPIADTAGVEARHLVDKTRCGGQKPMRPRGGSVLATPVTSIHAQAIALMVPGEEVTLGWSTSWPGVLDTLGGNPTLIEGGVVIESNVTGSSAFFGRHPRTGVGTTPDGRILFVVVDGRQKGYSVGMTLRELTDLFGSLGADWALNLDGGGSSTMTVHGEVINRPSDGSERGVSSALVLLPGADPGETASPTQPGDPVEAIRKSAVWPRVAADPASTGGLADHLARSGDPLARYLGGAAERFRSSR